MFLLTNLIFIFSLIFLLYYIPIFVINSINYIFQFDIRINGINAIRVWAVTFSLIFLYV